LELTYAQSLPNKWKDLRTILHCMHDQVGSEWAGVNGAGRDDDCVGQGSYERTVELSLSRAGASRYVFSVWCENSSPRFSQSQVMIVVLILRYLEAFASYTIFQSPLRRRSSSLPSAPRRLWVFTTRSEMDLPRETRDGAAGSPRPRNGSHGTLTPVPNPIPSLKENRGWKGAEEATSQTLHAKRLQQEGDYDGAQKAREMAVELTRGGAGIQAPSNSGLPPRFGGHT
jgi:hypothetical protein